ncbi:MAG TPA: hypothetical protein VGE24_17555 [Emticicia sp.]
MKSTGITTLLLLLIANFCTAQRNFIKGKIFTADKDTLIGYIDYKEWIESPNEISFKIDINQSATTYTNNQLTGFIIDSNQEIYHSLNFNIEKLPRSGNKVMFPNMKAYANRTKKIVEKAAFVRVLSSGKATLYHFVDKDSEAHFLVKREDILEVLVYHIIETKNYSANFKQYQTQLTTLLADACKKLPILSTDYYVNSMKKLIDNYNNCFGGPAKPTQTKTSQGRWEYGLIVGAGYTKMKHSIGTPFRNIEVQGDANITPVGGLFINYVFARGRGKFALLNEIHAYHFKSTTFYDNEYFYYDMYYAGLQHLFRYTFHVGMPSIYGLAGFSYAFIAKQNSTMRRRDGSIEDLVPMGYQVKKNDEQRAILGIGLGLKRLMVEARYYRGNGFSAGVTTAIPNNRIDLLLKLNFGKL